MLYEVRAKLPAELLDRLQEIAYRAEKATGVHISIEAVILATITHGVGPVERELLNATEGKEKPKLRLVVSN
jgi:hypothetical protein